MYEEEVGGYTYAVSEGVCVCGDVESVRDKIHLIWGGEKHMYTRKKKNNDVVCVCTPETNRVCVRENGHIIGRHVKPPKRLQKSSPGSNRVAHKTPIYRPAFKPFGCNQPG